MSENVPPHDHGDGHDHGHTHNEPAPAPREEVVREREVIVTNSGDGGRRSSGAGWIVGLGVLIILIIAAIAIVRSIGDSANIDVPDDVNINVDQTLGNWFAA